MRTTVKKNKVKESQSVLSSLTPTTAMTVVGDHNCSAADKNQRLAKLAKLEAKFEKGFRAAIEALRDIFADKLYLDMGFNSQDDYMTHRWAKSRQWAEDQLTWLKAVEFLESKGVKNSLHNLSKDAAQVFQGYQYRPAIFYGAYQRLTVIGVKPTKARL